MNPLPRRLTALASLALAALGVATITGCGGDAPASAPSPVSQPTAPPAPTPTQPGKPATVGQQPTAPATTPATPERANPTAPVTEAAKPALPSVTALWKPSPVEAPVADAFAASTGRSLDEQLSLAAPTGAAASLRIAGNDLGPWQAVSGLAQTATPDQTVRMRVSLAPEDGLLVEQLALGTSGAVQVVHWRLGVAAGIFDYLSPPQGEAATPAATALVREASRQTRLLRGLLHSATLTHGSDVVVAGETFRVAQVTADTATLVSLGDHTEQGQPPVSYPLRRGALNEIRIQVDAHGQVQRIERITSTPAEDEQGAAKAERGITVRRTVLLRMPAG